MKIHLLANIALLTSVLPGCLAHTTEPNAKTQHALLVAPNSVAVARVIANLLQSPKVHLADDVFINSSKVTLDRLQHKDPYGNTMMGKQLNMPDQFELLMTDKQCFVRHINSDAMEAVAGVECKINPL
jgi:hypothetical protein